MIISIVNRSRRVRDDELLRVIRAINRQIAEDFAPYWSFGATLRLEGRAGRGAADLNALSELRGDAVIYLADDTDVEGALGYHDKNARGIPYGFVFTALSGELGEPWSVTLSHEALELLGDPQGNLLVQGPHPTDPTREVFHWFEMCDAVQSQWYEIDGVQVANFVLPLYFTPDEQDQGRNDFLSQRDRHGRALASFGAVQGGYIGYFDPKLRQHVTWFPPEDKLAARRAELKNAHRYGRGYARKRGDATEAREDAHLAALWGRPKQKRPVDPRDPIQHVVVLMMENRSFDHMLGGIRRIYPQAEGINLKKPGTNTDSKGRIYTQKPGAAYKLNQQDPHHEYTDVQQQLGTAKVPLSGFVRNFEQHYPQATPTELQEVMAYYDFGDRSEQDALPVMHTLAREFTVCDHWFSSLPGPTWPNRFFVHSATSLGHVVMPSKQEPQNMRIYYQETIYDRLSDAGVSWKIFHDGIPQSIVMTRLLTRYLTFRGYDDMDGFFDAAKGRAEDFPQYCFIEPAYFGKDENDQHPPADVRQGEALIARIYNALRDNEALWQSTLFVVMYDEHGGFYDHVQPPATVAPDKHVGELGCQFNQLGLRVPALLISPWVDKGVVSTVFDHTSLLRYVCEKWGLPPLGQRMQTGAGALQAASIGPVLRQRSTPRTDAPRNLGVGTVLAAVAQPGRKAAATKGAKAGKAAKQATVPSFALAQDPPIEGAREALLCYIEQLPDVAAAPEVVPLKAATAGRAGSAKRGQRAKASAAPQAGKSGQATPASEASQRVAEGVGKLARLRQPHGQ